MDRIVVLGAGYAGLTAATSLWGRLRREDDVRITLVDAHERFTERLRLHQVAAGQPLADLRVPELLRDTGVEFVRGRVTRLDTGARTVHLDDGRALAYDRLVYALGAVADAGVEGVAEHAFSLDGRGTAERLAARLATLDRGFGAGGRGLGAASVAVVGSGPTGVEVVAEIAEAYPGLAVTLLGRDGPGAAYGPRVRGHIARTLAGLGVEVRAGAEVVGVDPEKIVLADGAVAADVVLWTGGVRAMPLAAVSGLEVDGSGRIITDAALRSVSHPEIHAVGDAAAVLQGYGVLHGTCQSGMPTGVHAATTIARLHRGLPARPFRFGYIHAPLSLGRADGAVQYVHPDDRPTRFSLTGPLAARYKETVSSAPWPAFERLLRTPALGTFAWRRGGRYTR